MGWRDVGRGARVAQRRNDAWVPRDSFYRRRRFARTLRTINDDEFLALALGRNGKKTREFNKTGWLYIYIYDDSGYCMYFILSTQRRYACIQQMVKNYALAFIVND